MNVFSKHNFNSNCLSGKFDKPKKQIYSIEHFQKIILYNRSEIKTPHTKLELAKLAKCLHGVITHKSLHSDANKIAYLWNIRTSTRRHHCEMSYSFRKINS